MRTMDFKCSKCGLGAVCVPTGINGFRVRLPDTFATQCPQLAGMEKTPVLGAQLDCEHMNRSGDLAFDRWLRRNGLV